MILISVQLKSLGLFCGILFISLKIIGSLLKAIMSVSSV